MAKHIIDPTILFIIIPLIIILIYLLFIRDDTETETDNKTGKFTNRRRYRW